MEEESTGQEVIARLDDEEDQGVDEDRRRGRAGKGGREGGQR